MRTRSGRGNAACLCGAGGAFTRLRSVPTEPRAPMKRGPCWRCSRILPLGAFHPQNRLALASPSPYVVNVCLKCFRCYQRYVASVSYECCKSRSGCYICCKCFRGILQVFVQNISFVLDVCCKNF
jgi:hypothetical protein